MSSPRNPGGDAPSPAPEDLASGPLAWFAGHPVAANLLMGFILVSGFLALRSTTIEIFPEFSIDTITIRVPYLGAAPEETEEGITVKVEEAVASIDGIDKIRSTAAEGMGLVTLELDDDADNREVLDEVKAAVDRIDTFPAETEKPIVSEVLNRRQVISVVLYGDVGEKTLSTLADRVRDDLTNRPDITQAEVKGLPPYEISIEVSEAALRRYGLTFQQVADVVRTSSIDLPGGSVKTEGGEILLRAEGQRYRGPEFEAIVLLTRSDGTRVRLGDVADVIDGFEDADIASRFDGQSAVLVQVYRVGDEGALEVTEATRAYVEAIRGELPAGVSIATWQDNSIILRQRINLLLKNAAFGLVLVFLCLALFLDLRLAFWTTMGIPISFLGGLWLVPHFGVSINMISLFAFIVALGIVVDDAIVVGENVFAKLEEGLPPLRAATEGVREMALPVTFAILTSVAAFMPLVFVDGTLGKVMRQIPIVVIAVLAISLVEGLLILPNHLVGHGDPDRPRGQSRLSRLIARPREATSGLLRRFVEGPYHDFLEWALSWRYLTISLALATLLLTFGIIGGGFLKFTFMPPIDADNMVAYLQMPQGTPAEQTEAISQRIEAAAVAVANRVEGEIELPAPLIRHVNTTIGEQPTSGGGGPGSSGATTGSGGHLAEVNVELLGGDQRDISSKELARRWREEVGEVAGATALTFTASLFSAGDAVSVQLAHQDFETLLAASDRLKQMIADYPGVTEIADSFQPGKRELKLGLTEEGRALGLTLAGLARQVRSGFYGEEAQRIQRGRDDVRVMVRYPEAERRSRGDLENARVRLPDGTEVPFSRVATVEEGRGYASIQRADRKRVVTVTADVDENLANADEINGTVRDELLPQLRREYPGLSWDFEGEQRQQTESLVSLQRNFVVALIAIFGLLAIPFRSYSQPLIVMSVIPFGLVGAVAGHMLLGLNLTLLSFFGLVALTGVVVNDSLILIDQINRDRRDGASLDEAIRSAGVRRFRPILLTTLTTFFGLTPMILETSLQAQFLVPMAVSLGFGVVFATSVTLVLVPVIYRILEDVHDHFGSTSVREAAVEEESEPPREAAA